MNVGELRPSDLGQELFGFADDEAWVQYDAGLRAGQSPVLNPGDRVRFEYDESPTWRWKPIR